MSFKNPFDKIFKAKKTQEGGENQVKKQAQKAFEEKQRIRNLHEVGKQLEITLSITPVKNKFEKHLALFVAQEHETSDEGKTLKKLKITCLDDNTPLVTQNEGELTPGDVVFVNRFGKVQIDEILE